METIVLNVKGMSCGHCQAAVEGELGKLPGVESASVDLDGGTVKVSYAPDKVTVNQLKEAVEEAGYEAV